MAGCVSNFNFQSRPIIRMLRDWTAMPQKIQPAFA
jgi:hypothetical protein